MTKNRVNSRLQATAVAIVSCWSLLLGPLTSAASAASVPLPANTALNLGSTTHSAIAPNISVVDIHVGSHPMAIAPGQSVTPAEMMAVMQVLQSGTQALLLNSLGAAIGGHAALTPDQVGANLQSLALPSKVSLVSLGFGNANPFNVNGSAQIGGSLYALQTQAGLASAMSFGDLTVLSGGLITTSLPKAFTVQNGFASSGLTINSTSGSIVNNGTITAATGNLTLTAPDKVNLSINNQGGSIQAAGDINVRAPGYDGTANETLTGGSWESQNLNLNAGKGTVEANVGTVTGTVNATAETMQMTASTPDLHLGMLHLSGDPTILCC